MNRVIKFFILAVFIVILLLILVNSNKSSTIKVGFISNFSTEYSEVGVQGRNGALLAIDEINSKGGIKGKKLELITGNSEDSIEKTKKVVKDLISNDISVLLGPLISKMGSSVIDGTKGSNILVISPSVKSDNFSNIDDNFIMLNDTTYKEGRSLSNAIINRGDKRVALLWSSDNSPYTSGVIKGIKKGLLTKGIVPVIEYEISEVENHILLVNNLIKEKIDSVSIIARGDIVAEITQICYRVGFKPNFYSSEWSKTSMVLTHGGRSVEGMIIYDKLNYTYKNIPMVNFVNTFKSHFFSDPTTTAILSYDAVMLFYEAMLETNLDHALNKLKDVITSGRSFNGLIQDYSFNEFGDVVRSGENLFIIEDGNFVYYDLFFE
ncbi:amino acid ABC transporter substrate-binding protein [Thiospirochaeta perfilievii]|uniref:Amino acid ABC transporter substrate-binding protein n=1 Tax=Thiospirochaeta perfilievii TaxID=252967 RepID=A0A5C1Q9M0_9SPIO|nr:ABC transporter substrate-binding protein [Thiospirochaeta perfilievii]QEN04167.1 amino acid ABC transporter substrate-binding protein [Thiospirochaeta perfilievii]